VSRIKVPRRTGGFWCRRRFRRARDPARAGDLRFPVSRAAGR
jgi:hypothetical protein